MADPVIKSAAPTPGLAGIPAGRRVTLDPVLRDLVADGLVTREEADRLITRWLTRAQPGILQTPRARSWRKRSAKPAKSPASSASRTSCMRLR